MKLVKPLVGLVHILAAIAVVLQQILGSTYESGDVWNVLNYVMFVAILLAVIFNAARKRQNDMSGDSGLTREYLESNFMYYITIGLSILFMYNWVAEFARGDDNGGTLTGIVWTVVNVTFVMVSSATGMYLLRPHSDATVDDATE